MNIIAQRMIDNNKYQLIYNGVLRNDFFNEFIELQNT